MPGTKESIPRCGGRNDGNAIYMTNNTTLSGKPQLNRKINMSILLDLIKRKGPLSRADLSKQTGIRAASISAIVQQLIDEKLVIETGLGSSTGGRQPTLLELNPSGLYAVGIEVEEDGLNAVLVNFTSNTLAKTHRPLPDTRPGTVVEAIASAVEVLCSETRVPRDRLAGIGVALPGIVDMGTGRVLLSRPMGWHNMGLAEAVSDRLGTDVRVLNNALAGALAASNRQEDSQAARSLLFVLVQFLQPHPNGATSLGCGIVLDGRAYIGSGNRAGEIHVDVAHPLERARAIIGDDPPGTIEDLVASSLRNPGIYRPVWDAFAKDFAEVVSRGIDFLNPGKVIVGTDIPETDSLIGKMLRERAQSSYFRDRKAAMGLPGDFPPVPIEFMAMETETLAKGAIVPHLQELSLAPSLRKGVLL